MLPGKDNTTGHDPTAGKSHGNGDGGADIADAEPTGHLLHLGDGPQPAALVGRSNLVIALRAALAEFAQQTPITALIAGKEGVGRKQVASVIHRESVYASQALRYMDCRDATPAELDALLSANSVCDRLDHTASELQGNSGLLIIDGVQRLAQSSQTRLTEHVHNIRRDAADDAAHCAVVLIVHGNVDEALESGELSEALYEALASHLIIVPELAGRGDDVLYIARHFVEALNDDLGLSKRLSVELERRLLGYHWPGNVQELKFLIHELYALTDDGAVIEADATLAPMLLSDEQRAVRDAVGTSVWDMQKSLLLETLSSVGGDKQRAAEILGISLKTLYNRLRDYR